MRLRIAVVGAGYMGPLHAEKLVRLASDDPGVELAGVVDIKPERARVAALRFGVPAYEDVREILPAADAVIVAVPTVEHYAVVRTALEAGVDVLVEKPIASTVEEGEHLLALARQHGRVLQVGHLEWFNAAMDVIRDHFRRPRYAEAYRVGPFPDRATDIDVVRDVMIHDLDILQQLLGDEPTRIEAVGVPVLTPNIDVANARLVYPGGCVANLTASRVSASPMRMIRFFQPDGYFSADFLNQAGFVARRTRGAVTPPSIVAHKVDVARGDALLAQLRAFVRAVRTRERPRVDGLDGLGALRTAVRVHDAIAAAERGATPRDVAAAAVGMASPLAEEPGPRAPVPVVPRR
jgi:predicted dehydrogenase